MSGAPRRCPSCAHSPLVWAPAQATLVLEKGTRFAETRFFLAGEILYVIFFDEAGAMRDFVCLDTSL